MLLESRISDKIVLLVDAESAGGVDKSALKVDTDPDRILDNTVAIAKIVAAKLGEGLEQQKNGPVTMEVRFAIRVNSDSVVALSKSATDGQFHCTMRWDA